MRPLLRVTIKELLLRAISGETWDPEGSWPASLSERSAVKGVSDQWLVSLGFPESSDQHSSISCILPPLDIYSKGEWHLQGFCDAAYALMCITQRQGLSQAENASLNAAAASCALREVLPHSPHMNRVRPLLVRMAATQGAADFARELVEFLSWVHGHVRVGCMRMFLISSAVEIMQTSCHAMALGSTRDHSGIALGASAPGACEVHEKLRTVCAAILSEFDPYLGSDQVKITFIACMYVFMCVCTCA